MMMNNKREITKRIYKPNLKLIAFSTFLATAATTGWLLAQDLEVLGDLEAPVPSITIEDDQGTTDFNGGGADVADVAGVTDVTDVTDITATTEEEILPPMQTDSLTPSSAKSSTAPTSQTEDGLTPIQNSATSQEKLGSWDGSNSAPTSTVEEITSIKAIEDTTTSISPSELEEISLDTETTSANEDQETPIAVGTRKDPNGNEINAAQPTATKDATKAVSTSTGAQSVTAMDEDLEVSPLEIAPSEGPAENKVVATPTNKPSKDVSEESLMPNPSTDDKSKIVGAPQAPTPPPADPVSSLSSMDPPTVSASESDEADISLGDLPIGTLPDVPLAPMEKDANKEVEIAKLIQQLQEDAANKEVAKSSLVPNQMQDEINFDNVPIGAAFRLLAEQAGFNFVEPPFQEGETLSLRFQKMTPLDAFMKIAQARGYAVVTESGFTTLRRPDIALPEFFEVRKYKLKFIQPKWIIQSIANLLEIQITQPADTLASFPEPNEDATSYGGSNDGNSGGGGGTTTAGSTGNNGSQNIGLPTSPRWTASLPYDEPLHSGENGQGGEVPFVFIDRSTSSLVVKTTKEKQNMVAQYIANVDKPEPQIMIETKVVEINMGDLLTYGTDWADALGKGIKVESSGIRINLNEAFTSGANWTGFLTIPEMSVTIKAFQEMDKGAVMNMPRTMTRSGVPVSISSTITDATPAYQISTGTGGTGAVSTPSGFNTFTTGLTIDVVPQILENGMIDINVNPTVANKIGERTIEENTQTGTPKQTIPIISSRSLTTSAIVPSGMTIMLGGIVETRNGQSDGGIPVLSRLPFLGRTVFGNTSKEDTRKTLIVFVTPKVIYPDEYQKVWTNEEEWRAMIDGNRADIQAIKETIPQPLEIRKALPIRDTLNPGGVPTGKRK